MTLSLGCETVSEYGTRTMAEPIVYLTQPSRLVLRAFLDEPGPFWNYGLAQDLNIKTTTVLNVLRRLADAGWVVPRPEEPGPLAARGGRQPRVYYDLTPEGREAATARLAETEQRRTRRQPRGRDLPDEVSSHSIGASQTDGHLLVRGAHAATA